MLINSINLFEFNLTFSTLAIIFGAIEIIIIDCKTMEKRLQVFIIIHQRFPLYSKIQVFSVLCRFMNWNFTYQKTITHNDFEPKNKK